MRTLRKAWFLRPLAWLTTVALLSPMLLTASPAQAAAPPATVAVVQVSNQSGSSVQNLASRLAAALTEKLALSGQFKAIGQAAVDQAIDAAGIRLPLRADTRAKQLADIAAALTSDYLIVAAIDNVEVDAERQVAAVTTRLELYSRLAGGELTTAETTAFNLARSNNAAVLVDDALDQAALYAVRELASNLAIVGKVTSPPLEDTVRISLSESDALRKGAQFSLLRDGVKYGTAELLLARGGDAECRLVERLRPEITPGVNDTAVLYKQGRGEPTAHDPDVDPGKDVPTGAERSRSNTGKVLGIIGGVALLALGVWAYFAAQDDREEARTASLVNPPNNSTLQVDSTNGLINALTFTATSVRSSEQLTLQVANDPNFASLAYTETKVVVERWPG
ncbi:MAG: hypothetical protein HUU35_11155 [Armatimonadetes bacterium]|nr:hypothetical protein [Armatimonadota bacterium]